MSEAVASSPSATAAAKVRILHGKVFDVRAVPSREVSTITVDLPHDHHVGATGLVHGQRILILRSPLEEGTRYGLLDFDAGTDPMALAQGGDDGNESDVNDSAIIHAYVTAVRPIPSREVSRLAIDVPIAQHVLATNILHDRDVIVFPVNLPKQTPFGLLDLGGRQACATPRPKPSSFQSLVVRPAGSSPRPGPAKPEPIRSTLRSREPSPSSQLGQSRKTLVITTWLGKQCASDVFQDWLGVRNQGAAEIRVRELCGVKSRAEIRDSVEAIKRFQDNVFEPFTRHVAQLERSQTAVDASAEHPPRERSAP